MEDMTKATRCIDLTDADKNDGSENIDDDKFTSIQVVGNLNISKNILNFLREIIGLIICPITHEDMLDPLLGTDHTSYERESIRHWIELHQQSPSTREHMKMHYLMPDYTMRRIEKNTLSIGRSQDNRRIH